MHVAQVNFFPAPPGCAPDALFERWPSLAAIPEATATSGIRVSVIQAADHDVSLRRGGITYHFVDVRTAHSSRVRAARMARVIRGLNVDVVHVHSLGFARSAAWLRRGLAGQPVLLQDHADQPPSRWLRLLWRRWYAVADGVAFTALALARPFMAAHLLQARTRVYAIPESTSHFVPGDTTAARQRSGLHGDPCVACVGHLSAGKGILTVLDGVARATVRLPGLQLWLAYGSAPLRADVQHRIDNDPRLRGRVHLLGSVPHADIEGLMRSADIFVSGSLSESTGYAALEALACGAFPVLTDIPAFQALTADGRVGSLWPVGDAQALASALGDAVAIRPSRAAIREHFDASLSSAALGRRWAAAYADLLGRQAQGAVG